MASDLIDYHGDGEHTHTQRTQPIVWCLAAGLILLAVVVAVLASYLAGRATLADRRNGDTRAAICTILNALPPDPRTPPKAVAAFRQAYRLERCRPMPAPKLTHRSTKPGATVTATATAVATAPARVTVSPHPRVTVTKHPTAKPRVTVTRTRKPHPSRTPTPEPSCLLGIKTSLTCTK